MTDTTQPLLAFHLYHDQLAAFIDPTQGGLEGRTEYIRRCKPHGEIPKRLNLIKPIDNALLPIDVREAAEKVLKRLTQHYDFVPFVEAERQLMQIVRNSRELRDLHERLCPGCPWDGKSIFP